MTSLYDQFHSQKNINHIYNLIDDLIQQKIGKSIKDNMQYFTYYNNKLREIFIESDETELVGLNKELLSHHFKYFLDELKESKESNIQANNHILNTPRVEQLKIEGPKVEEPRKEIKKDNNSNVMSQFNAYVQQRDIPRENIRKTEVLPDNKKEVSFDDMINDMNDSKKLNNEPIEDEPIEPMENEPIESIRRESIEPIKDKLVIPIKNKPFKIESSIKSFIDEESIKETITFTSVNRIDIESNRFNYRVKCERKINKLEKLIIPIEQSIHFAIPILNLKIKEFGLDTNIYLKDTYKLNNYTYGVYKPDNFVKIYSDVQKELSIEILSIYDDSKYNNDIYECELEDDTLILEDIDDFKVNDIVSINSKEFIKIIEIEDGKLRLESKPGVEEKNKVYIMNMNLQNTLVFY